MRSLKDVNWNQVYSFFEVARRLSMKEAAQALDLTTSTISEQIKRLEEMLDVRLFNRMTRRIDLTPEGRVLYDHAREMFETGARFLDAVSPHLIGGYSTRVGVLDSLVTGVAVDFLTRYWDVFAPFGTVNTQRLHGQDELLERVASGGVDWALSFEKPLTERFAVRKVTDLELVFCCSPAVFHRLGDPRLVLSTLPVAHSARDQIVNRLVDEHLRRAETYPEEILYVDHRELCVELVRRGRCVAAFARSTVESEAWAQDVASFTLDAPMYLALYAIWLRPRERMISVRKLRELLESSGTVSDDPFFQVELGAVENQTD